MHDISEISEIAGPTRGMKSPTRRQSQRHDPHSAFGMANPKTPMEVYRQPIALAINQ